MSKYTIKLSKEEIDNLQQIESIWRQKSVGDDLSLPENAISYLLSLITQQISASIHITNLDESISEKHLYDHYKKYGLICSTQVYRDTLTRISLGRAVIHFNSIAAANAALECKELLGMPILSEYWNQLDEYDYL